MSGRRCRVVVNTTNGMSYRFAVETANTLFQRARGLMGRTAWNGSDGMLFVYPWPRVTGIWMAGTHLALDAVFIAADGKVCKIAHELVPHTRHTEYSGTPVKWVLEVPAGTCRRIGLEVSAAVEVMEDRTKAGWMRWLAGLSGRFPATKNGKETGEGVVAFNGGLSGSTQRKGKTP